MGCCLVCGDHRLGMSAVEPELCSGLSFLCVEGTRTARPSRRRGKQQPGGLLFSARGSPSGNVCRGSCGSKDFMAFCFVSYGCTVSARSVLSMSDYVGRCIALQSVPFFASGEQCQAEFCLHFRVGILEQFQQSRHRDKGCASAWAASPSGTLLPSRWTETINCHAHLRILLPQNRCLPEPLAAPFPHQPEPRCNTLDFAGKVVCQRGAASRLSARSGASKCAAF